MNVHARLRSRRNQRLQRQTSFVTVLRTGAGICGGRLPLSTVVVCRVATTGSVLCCDVFSATLYSIISHQDDVERFPLLPHLKRGSDHRILAIGATGTVSDVCAEVLDGFFDSAG